MWYAICIIIGIILGGGGMWTYQYSLPPKTVVNNNYTTQNVNTEQSSVTRVDQSQTTMILGANGSTNYRTVLVSGSGKTNVYYFSKSSTNISHKTN